MRVVDLDHVVLNVADVERSLGFCTGPPGLAPVRVDEWRAGKVQGARWGARGEAKSVYVSDPDGNTVELRWYPQDVTA